MKQFALTMSLAVAALFAIPSSTFAQDKPAGDHPQHRMDPQARLQFLTEKLGLTADQQSKIKAIFEQNAPKFKELMSKGRENLTDADKTALHELMKSQGEAVNAVLTPEQQEKFKALHHGGRGGHGEGKPAAPKPAAE